MKDGTACRNNFKLTKIGLDIAMSRGYARSVCISESSIAVKRMQHANITAECIAALDATDFVWDPRILRKRQNMFQQLAEYREQYGQSNVPMYWPWNPRLSLWVKHMRQCKKKYDRGEMDDAITAERIAALNAMGFVWNYHEARWQEMYHQLVEYQKQYGNCNVPRGGRHNPSLGSWVDSHRMLKKWYDAGKPSSLTQRRIDALERMGFEWRVRELAKR
jgi:hypothetical protein